MVHPMVLVAAPGDIRDGEMVHLKVWVAVPY